MTALRDGTWLDAEKDLPVQGADGHVWKLVSLKRIDQETATVTMARYVDGELTERSKVVNYLDPIKIAVSPALEGFDPPLIQVRTSVPGIVAETEGVWHFPDLEYKLAHYESHLFIVHGEAGILQQEGLKPAARLLALKDAHTLAHEVGHEGFPHLHGVQLDQVGDGK